MSKGFERFQELFAQKQNELNIQTRNAQKTKEDETARKQEEARQKQIESDQKAAENKKIFEAAGVVKLFEEIRDTRIVEWRKGPIYGPETLIADYKDTFFGKKRIGSHWGRVKIRDYEPAHMTWGPENNSISLSYDYWWAGGDDPDVKSGCTSITLHILSGKKIGTIESIDDPNDKGFHDHGGIGKSGYDHGMVYRQIQKETEILNIPEYVANKISNPYYPKPNPYQ